MKVKVIDSGLGRKWDEGEGRYRDISESEAFEQLAKEVETYLIRGYIPIGSPQKYDDGWILMMYKKD